MTESKGVMTIAEGIYDYRVDVNLVLDGGRRIKKYVLRTTLISLGVWKSKYAKNVSPFEKIIGGVSKAAAVSKALVDAAKKLGISGSVNFWVFSNNMNPKIPKQDLHDALKDGSATSVTTDDSTKHIFFVGSNDGLEDRKIKTNLHLATLKI